MTISRAWKWFKELSERLYKLQIGYVLPREYKVSSPLFPLHGAGYHAMHVKMRAKDAILFAEIFTTDPTLWIPLWRQKYPEDLCGLTDDMPIGA